ncbi:MAG TPA: hypothetical protein PLS25_04990 [Methanoregulaceae archaeon]|nr:hypothetical protein [Methanoregulaceae archaeon]
MDLKRKEIHSDRNRKSSSGGPVVLFKMLLSPDSESIVIVPVFG